MTNNSSSNLPANVTPKLLTAADQAELLHLQNRVAAVAAREGRAVAGRALLVRNQDAFILRHGIVSVTQHAKNSGFVYEATSLAFHLAAQLLLNVDVNKAAEADKERLRGEVAMLARALADLDARASKHRHLDDDAFVKWYEAEGRISGLAKSYLASKRQDKASSNRKSNTETAMSPDEQVEAIFDNPAAVEIDALAGIPTGQEGLFMYRQEGDKLRLIPLTAPPAKLIELAGLAPDPLTNAAKDLLFHRQMLLAGGAFVPDELSGMTVEEVPEGDVANDTYTMLPANGIYLVERGHISIAHARRDDGIIVQVSPKDVDPGYALIGGKYLDNRTRRRLGAALLGEADAAQFALSAVDGVAAKISGSGKSRTLTFTHKASGAKVNLIVKPRDMGSIWTYRVSSAFAPTAQAIMDDAAVANFDATFVKALLKKQPERIVTIAIGDGGILTDGIDFEKEVLRIMQKCRSADEADREFDELTERIKDSIDATLAAARAKVLENMDADVVAKLHRRNEALAQILPEFKQRLLMVAKAELPDAQFPTPDSESFGWDGRQWTTKWPLADENDWQFFRVNEGLGHDLIERAKGRAVSDGAEVVRFDPAAYAYAGQLGGVPDLSGQSGWLRAFRAIMPTPGAEREEVIVIAETDAGEMVKPQVCDKMMMAPAQSLGQADGDIPHDRLTQLQEFEFGHFSERVKQENYKWLIEEEERLGRYARDMEIEIEAQIAALDEELKDLNRQKLSPHLGMEEKVTIMRDVRKKNDARDELKMSQFDTKKQVSKDINDKLDAFSALLDEQPRLEEMFTLRWTVA